MDGWGDQKPGCPRRIGWLGDDAQACLQTDTFVFGKVVQSVLAPSVSSFVVLNSLRHLDYGSVYCRTVQVGLQALVVVC